jgi:hypothetical protein
MRNSFILTALTALLAACSSGRSASPGTKLPSREEPVRVVYKQYRKGSLPLIMENLRDRDLVKLRSEKLTKGQSPVAYVPDDVMARMLREFKRYGWTKYGRPRPPDPAKYGAAGEITIITDNRRRMVTLLRIRGGDVATNRAYVDCVNTFVAVYNHYGPKMQATTSTTDAFGVRRVER